MHCKNYVKSLYCDTTLYSNCISCYYNVCICFVMTLDNPFVQWLYFVTLHTICMTWCLFSVGRVTEIAEEDTFLCESKVQEADRTVKRLGKGLKVREQSQQAFPLGLVP